MDSRGKHKYLNDLRAGEDFSNRTQNMLTIDGKIIGKLGYVKIKNLSSLHDTINKMNMEWEKILQYKYSTKDLC